MLWNTSLFFVGEHYFKLEPLRGGAATRFVHGGWVGGWSRVGGWVGGWATLRACPGEGGTKYMISASAVGGPGFALSILVVVWRHALEREWPFIVVFFFVVYGT